MKSSVNRLYPENLLLLNISEWLQEPKPVTSLGWMYKDNWKASTQLPFSKTPFLKSTE